MSSKVKGKASERSGSGIYPTQWSEWEWNADYNCDVRYRLQSPNDYEHQYDSGQMPRDATTKPDAIAEQYSYPLVENYMATTIDAMNLDLERSSIDPDPVTTKQISLPPPPLAQAAQSGTGTDRGHIRTRDKTIKKEAFEQNYKVHKASEFEWGRVFKVLWAEPKGSSSSQSALVSQYSLREGKHGERFYEKVQRFLIIDSREGHCVCLPIMTYSSQGVNKMGVKASDHAIIYTERPVWFHGEEAYQSHTLVYLKFQNMLRQSP